MNIKYDSISGVRDFSLKKVQVSESLKKLKVPIADESLVHHVLTLVPVQFDQLKVSYNALEHK